jgi:hypothetical protein
MGMRRVIRGWLVPVVLLVLGVLVAGCGSTVKNVIASVAPSHSISLPTNVPASPVDTVTPSPVTPTTAPPPTTAAPTTAPPTTAAPTTPAATTAAPTPSPTSTSSTSTSTPAWLWLILALVVIAGVAFILIARASSKRSAVSGQWQSAVTDVYARGSALHDAMASVEWPSGPTAGSAQARWVDIQNRADDLAQALYRMRETAPDEDSRMRVDDVLSSLQSVRAAMDAERSQGGGTERNEYSRTRLYAFARSLRALRSDPQGPGTV